jgi:hypothetical protein
MRKSEKEISSLAELESIIEKADVCRLAFADMNTPYIVTMNFGYLKGEPPCLFFHCAPEGRKIDMIKKNNYVCFSMDTDHSLGTGEKACDFTMNYKSITGYGHIYIIDNEENKKEGLDVIMSHYSKQKSFEYRPGTLARTTVLKLEISELTGKKSTGS